MYSANLIHNEVKSNARYGRHNLKEGGGKDYSMVQLLRGGTSKPDKDSNKQRKASKQHGRGEGSKGELIPPGRQHFAAVVPQMDSG
jgi:hypothetical protein